MQELLNSPWVESCIDCRYFSRILKVLPTAKNSLYSKFSSILCPFLDDVWDRYLWIVGNKVIYWHWNKFRRHITMFVLLNLYKICVFFDESNYFSTTMCCFLLYWDVLLTVIRVTMIVTFCCPLIIFTFHNFIHGPFGSTTFEPHLLLALCECISCLTEY